MVAMYNHGSLTRTWTDFGLTALHCGSRLSPPGQPESDAVRGRAILPQGRC